MEIKEEGDKYFTMMFTEEESDDYVAVNFTTGEVTKSIKDENEAIEFVAKAMDRWVQVFECQNCKGVLNPNARLEPICGCGGECKCGKTS